MMERTLLKKVAIGISSLFLIAFLGVGCATEDQIKAHREAAEAAAVRAEAAAKKAEEAAVRADACADKCEKTFEKGLRK
jgi:membrane protein required for beta-lactamase induction